MQVREGFGNHVPIRNTIATANDLCSEKGERLSSFTSPKFWRHMAISFLKLAGHQLKIACERSTIMFLFSDLVCCLLEPSTYTSGSDGYLRSCARGGVVLDR